MEGSESGDHVNKGLSTIEVLVFDIFLFELTLFSNDPNPSQLLKLHRHPIVRFSNHVTEEGKSPRDTRTT